jgi:hypothetical protein
MYISGEQSVNGRLSGLLHKYCCRCLISFLSNIQNSGNISIYRSALMTNTHQTQGGKFGANPALSRNCNEILASLSQDARRFVYNHVFHLRGMDDG